MSRQMGRRTRFRVGRVSVYFHHGSWWVYHRDGNRRLRRKVGALRDQAEQIAAQINAQLTTGTPSLLSFEPILVPALRQQFLDRHEHVLKSSLATVNRYRAATQHLVNFAVRQARPPRVHEIKADAFAAYLRTLEVGGNGHPNARRRRLRDKGVQFILETCRAMYTFAGKRRHLPPYAANPFAELPLDRLKIEDAKPIFVFDCETELAFLEQANTWEFSIHFTLAKTGLRPGELIHLLMEDVDLEGRWLHVRNKPELGWRIKTGAERSVPLLPEARDVLRRLIGGRTSGPVFLRLKFQPHAPSALVGSRRELAVACEARQRHGGPVSRRDAARIARSVWRDAGVIKPDAIRQSFIRIAQAIGKPEATCPKSWRHTFATLLQDANVDPLIRQITLGHKAAGNSGLGMTGHYTHTRPETLREQIEAALRRWPRSLELVNTYLQGGMS